MSLPKPRLIDIDVKAWRPTTSEKQPKKIRYPAKPQLRKHHWFLGGLLVIFCGWVSFSSTASISPTPLQVSKAEFDKLKTAPSNHSVEKNNLNDNLGNINSNVVVETVPVSPNLETIEYKIKRGDTLGSIFEKMGLPRVLPHNIAEDSLGKRLKNISVGRILRFELTDSLPTKISYAISALKNLEVDINPNDNSVIASEVDIEHETVTHVASASIESSLFLAANRAGISDNMIMEMAAIFGWDIDFVRDIRKGDHFTFVYEQYEKDGKVLSEGNILAAEFVNAGETFSAVRFTDSNDDTGYYSPDGKSMKGTFLKSPMKFSRISSGFSKRRFHPVLKKWRAHKGVDYAAATGTPIRTTANGKVTFVGTKGGYGRTVVINHGGRYSTLYAHMSRYKKGVRSGSYVKQGQTIGYVGSSGLATGPHLHYEFRVNGVHRNSLTYKTPKSTPVSKKDMARFKTLAATQLALLKPAIENESIVSIAEDGELTNNIASTKSPESNDQQNEKQDTVLTR